MKAVSVSKETHARLMKLKIEMKVSSLDSVIKRLIEVYESRQEEQQDKQQDRQEKKRWSLWK